MLKEIDIDAFAEKVTAVVEFIEREDVSAADKNEMLHYIIEKVVFDRPNGNVALYFQDV